MNWLVNLNRLFLCGVFLVSASSDYGFAEDLNGEKQVAHNSTSDASLESPSSPTEETNAIYDPLEKLNRGIFWFNDNLDVYLLEPVATVYDKIIPDPAQKGVNNFFSNIRYPVNLLSDLIQLKFSDAGNDTARFLLNTTVGIAGLFDVAEDFGLERNYQDFGTALGHWGVGPGAYVVLPIIGPSCSRDGLGRLVDTMVNPIFYVNYIDMENRYRNIIGFSALGLELIQSRADLLEALKTSKEASLDYYSFVRSAYTQRRSALINGDIGFKDEEVPPGADG